MTHKCEGCFKPKTKGGVGDPCTHNASYFVEGEGGALSYYCGFHKVEECVAIKNVRPRALTGDQGEQSLRAKAANSGSVSSVYNEIYERILDRIGVGDVPNAPHFVALTNMDRSERDIIVRRASELSGVKDDILLIARSISEAIAQYANSCNQPRLQIENNMFRLKAMGAEWDPVVSSCFAEEGNLIYLSDVDMRIINCSAGVLKESGISFQDFCKYDGVIYMGPRGIIKSNIGELIPSENSRWYIPLPINCPLRQLHNKAMVIQILDDIAGRRNGETAEKYLALRGKVLACVCVPYPCHCEVYVEVVRELLRADKMKSCSLE